MCVIRVNDSYGPDKNTEDRSYIFYYNIHLFNFSNVDVKHAHISSLPVQIVPWKALFSSKSVYAYSALYIFALVPLQYLKYFIVPLFPCSCPDTLGQSGGIYILQISAGLYDVSGTSAAWGYTQILLGKIELRTVR